MAAPVPMTMATEESSQTRRSTVKSRRTEECEFTGASGGLRGGGFLEVFDFFEGADEAGAELAEFAGVVFGEVLEDFAAFLGDGEDDAAAVVGVFGADEEAFCDGAVDQLDDGVVAEAEALGGVGDGGERAVGCSGDLQQELMLLGMQIDFVGGLLAEVGEGAEVVAELGEGLEESGFAVGESVFPLGRVSSVVITIYIVSRYKLIRECSGWKIEE